MEILGSLPLFHSESMRMRKGWSSDGELNNGLGDGPQLGPQTRSFPIRQKGGCALLLPG